MKARNKINSPLANQVCELQDRIKSLEKELADQKQIQDSLTISEKNLSAILEQNADGIIIVNTEGIVLYVNPAAELLFNKQEEEFLGSLFGFPVSTENDYSSLIIKGDAFCEVELRVVQVKWQGQPAFQLSVRDITKLKQAEEELIISEEKFKSITENSADAIFIADNTGKYVYTNKAVTELLGFSPEEMKSKTIIGMAPENRIDEYIDIFNSLQVEGKIFTEIDLLKKDGTFVSTDLNSVVLPGGLVYGSCRDITERKQAEKEILDLAKFPSQNPNPVIRIDDKNIVLYANEAAKMFLQNWSCGVGDTAPDVFFSKNTKLSDDKPEKVIEIEHNQRFYTFFVTPIINEGYINLYGIDITERKKVQKKLAWEKYLTDTLLANIPDLIFFKDLNSRYIRINKALSDHFKLRGPHEALDKSDKDFFEPNFSQKTYIDEQEIIKTGKPIINQEEFKSFLDKSSLWSSTTKMPLRNGDGDIIGTFGISSDITKQKQSEEELLRAKEKAEENEAKFRELFSRVADAIFIYDPDSYEIVEANEATSAIYGYRHDELIGMSCLKLSAELEKSISVAKAIQNKENINIKVRHHKKKDGTDVFVELNNYKILVNGKNIVYSVCHDITDIKKTEAELIKAKDKAEESDRLKTSFLNNISHEIRTPMNAIVGFSGLLNAPDLNTEKRQVYIDIVVQSSNNLLSIIDDIVRIASIEAGQEKIQEDEVNLNSLFKLINEQFRSKDSLQQVELSYTTTLTDGDAIIITDAIKLTQILTNLVGNALKFTHEGNVNFGYEVKNNHLEFYVKDSGIGISPEMHEEIFKRFRQVDSTNVRQYGGSGLGLSISKAYVEFFGGKIWLSSELNKGSTFYFTLPYNKVKPKELPKIDSFNELNNHLENLNILLIAEDDDMNYLLLKEIFLDMDIKIVRAVNGIEAVQLCKSNPQIDLVLMDIKMPQMDGYEASKRIIEFKPELKIIAQTAYSNEEDRKKAYACGISDFISKPINRELLFSKMNEQLHK
jgi:PAS domain S-box-containing protein